MFGGGGVGSSTGENSQSGEDTAAESRTGESVFDALPDVATGTVMEAGSLMNGLLGGLEPLGVTSAMI